MYQTTNSAYGTTTPGLITTTYPASEGVSFVDQQKAEFLLKILRETGYAQDNAPQERKDLNQLIYSELTALILEVFGYTEKEEDEVIEPVQQTEPEGKVKKEEFGLGFPFQVTDQDKEFIAYLQQLAQIAEIKRNAEKNKAPIHPSWNL